MTRTIQEKQIDRDSTEYLYQLKCKFQVIIFIPHVKIEHFSFQHSGLSSRRQVIVVIQRHSNETNSYAWNTHTNYHIFRVYHMYQALARLMELYPFHIVIDKYIYHYELLQINAPSW